MVTTIEAPADYIEELARLDLPLAAQERLQDLMDRNNEGALGEAEAADLRALVELSERLTLIRGQARVLLQKPGGEVEQLLGLSSPP